MKSFLLVILPKGKRLFHTRQRKNDIVVVLCDGETELLNWVVFLVQSFDPDILIGYDIERRSWGFAVERAAKIGRFGFTRDISRLAPGEFEF